MSYKIKRDRNHNYNHVEFDDKSIQLLPCPFCGANGIIFETDLPNGYFYPTCSTPINYDSIEYKPCPLSNIQEQDEQGGVCESFSDPLKAVEMWNRRDKRNKSIPITPEDITELKLNEIFVFGSNTEGRHGAGAAKVAMKFGAEYGKSKGLYGNTYAIITQDLAFPGQKTIGIQAIKQQIDEMLTIARTSMSDYTFLVTAIGTGLAGYSFEEIASCFNVAELPDNVSLPQSIIDHIHA